jgi:hypothetical protein
MAFEPSTFVVVRRITKFGLKDEPLWRLVYVSMRERLKCDVRILMRLAKTVYDQALCHVVQYRFPTINQTSY